MLINIASNLLWSEGAALLGIILVIGLIGKLFFRPMMYLSTVLFLFSFYFFRNPTRVCVEALHNRNVLVCPADGRVVSVSYDKEGLFDGYTQRISIFLSPFDVHVNWAPMAGNVSKILYRPGTFMMAFLPKSSEYNERNDLALQDEEGRMLVVRQIAGTIARRICCWVETGQTLAVGEKYGMIRFGSRVDILLPDGVDLVVGLGQKVLGGETILGYWSL